MSIVHAAGAKNNNDDDDGHDDNNVDGDDDMSLYWPPSWQIPNRAQRSEPGETFLIGLHENEVSQRCVLGFTIEQMFLFSCLNMMSCAFRIIFHQTEAFSSLASDNLTCCVTFNHVSKMYSLAAVSLTCGVSCLCCWR